jgi:hypothetical protein
VNVHGSHRFGAPREAAFTAIRGPHVPVGVIPGNSPIPAIVNAIHHACDVRVDTLAAEREARGAA